MSKKFIQKQQKALADIAAKTLLILSFLDDTPELRACRIALMKVQGWEAFSFFCRGYFPHMFGLPFCSAHEIMFREVDENNGITAITGVLLR